MNLDDLLAQARAGLDRLDASAAAREMEEGALLVDIRPSEQRERDGLFPGAVIIDRNVLEWRLAPGSTHRSPVATGPEQRVIIACNEGYASSLAAATLRQLGLHNATDLAGGFQAWRAAGLPVERA